MYDKKKIFLFEHNIIFFLCIIFAFFLCCFFCYTHIAYNPPILDIHSWMGSLYATLLIYHCDSFINIWANLDMNLAGVFFGYFFRIFNFFNINLFYIVHFLLYFICIVFSYTLLGRFTIKNWIVSFFCCLIWFHPLLISLARTMNSLTVVTFLLFIYFVILVNSHKWVRKKWHYWIFVVIGLLIFFTHRSQLCYFICLNLFYLIIYKKSSHDNYGSIKSCIYLLLCAGIFFYFLLYYSYGFIDKELLYSHMPFETGFLSQCPVLPHYIL